MSAAAASALCEHCGLPVGRRPEGAELDGEPHLFCCYGCSLAFQVRRGSSEESDAAWLLIRLGVGAFLAMNIKLFSLLIYAGTFSGEDAHLLPLVHLLLWLLATPLLLVLGWPFARDAWAEARRGQLTANTLMSLGVGAAYLYSALAMLRGGAVYFDTVALLLVLFTLGRLLEAAARARAVRSLAPMLEAERRTVSVVDDQGGERPVPLREIRPGLRVRVLPGERVPVDGRVVEGHSHVDEAIVTGEPRPVPVQPGSLVVSGSINQEGVLIVESTVAGTDSRWARICRQVRESLGQRGPAQRLADRVAGAFVPLVLLLALGAAWYWSHHAGLEQALFTALAVLVVACPCALGLAAPLATTLGIGSLVQRGVQVRGPEVLERLTGVRVAAFDKTGTLTAGRVRLAAIATEGASADDLLRRVAALERGSSHPLAHGVLEAAAERGVQTQAARDIRNLPGRGIGGCAHGAHTLAGNALLMAGQGWAVPAGLAARVAALEASGGTVVHVGWDGRWRGALVFEDAILPESAATVCALMARGLHCELLTGDLPAAAERVARAVAVDAWQAGLTPEEKLAAMRHLECAHGPVLMVGDGINDGPVLAAAAVGVAVGSATDLARETADMTLPPGGLALLPWVLDRARQVRRILYGNLAWAFGYNAIALALAAAGYLTPVLAAVIMAGSSLIVIANSMRLERRDRGTRAHPGETHTVTAQGAPVV